MRRVIRGDSWTWPAGDTGRSRYKVEEDQSGMLTVLRCYIGGKKSTKGDFHTKKLGGRLNDKVYITGYTPESERHWFRLRCWRTAKEK